MLIGLFYCREPAPKASFLQIAILTNHMAGRDSHLRQVKVYGPKSEYVLIDDIPLTQCLLNSIRLSTVC